MPSPTQEKVFILHYLGINIEFRLWGKDISENLKEVPFRYSWKYLGMYPKSIEGVDEEALKAILCEALQVYKQFGICNKRTNVTEITFFDFEGEK